MPYDRISESIDEYIDNVITQYPTKPLSLRKRQALSKQAMEGNEEAKEKLILSCLRYGMKHAIKWARRNPEIDVEDFIQAASVGLIDAVSLIDSNRGEGDYLACAKYHVFKAINRVYINKSIIRMPCQYYYPRTRQGDIKKKETASNIELLKRKVKSIHGIDVSDNGDSKEEFNRGYLIECLQIIIDDLPEFEKNVIRMRYLSEERTITLRAIANRLGKSKQSVAMAEKRAIKRIKEMAEEREIA